MVSTCGFVFFCGIYVYGGMQSRIFFCGLVKFACLMILWLFQGRFCGLTGPIKEVHEERPGQTTIFGRS